MEFPLLPALLSVSEDEKVLIAGTTDDVTPRSTSHDPSVVVLFWFGLMMRFCLQAATEL